MPSTIATASPALSHRYGHAPSPLPGKSLHTVASAERLLSEWFGAEVVLTSSGRAGYLLYLAEIGLNRYRDTVALPRMISACVLDPVIRRAFPIDAEMGERKASLTVLYHQYGVPQAWRPDGAVLEDICHAFFATAETGARAWAGQAAVFSLPKFFVMSSMSGGIVVNDRALAERLRERRDNHDMLAPAVRSAASETWRKAHEDQTGGPVIERIYLERLLWPRIGDEELSGLPATLSQIKDLGTARKSRLERFFPHIDWSAQPEGWRSLLLEALPFALPVFGALERLAIADQQLSEAGIIAGVYRIDRARTMARPDYQAALLLPCHQQLPSRAIDYILTALSSIGK